MPFAARPFLLFFRYLFILSLVIPAFSVTAETAGTTVLRGKIIDVSGEALIGATVVLTHDKGKGTTSDLDGNYSLKIVGKGTVSLTISYIGYKSIEEDVALQPGNVVVRNFALSSASVTIKEAVITAKAVKSSDNYMQRIKSKSAVSLDYISSATIKKTGDANVGAALARIPGVSSYGGFITVRGIGDRYIATTVNGLSIPTLDPFTNNIKLDFFPAALVDNIVVTKDLSPDLPGNWAGAYISIETKDFPEKLQIDIETSLEYNPQTSGKQVISSERSATDWLGYDNGYREFNHASFADVVDNMTPYHQMLGLGLESFYDSLGVNASTPWNEDYFKMGLVELGLLPMAMYNDPVSIEQATDIFFSSNYSIAAYNSLNAAGANTGESLPNNWQPISRKAPLSFTQTFTIGDQRDFGKRQLGYIAGFRYGSATLAQADATYNRTSADASGTMMYTEQNIQEVSKEVNGWNVLLSASLKLNKFNSFSLMFMPNFIGTNNARNATDKANTSGLGVQILSQNYEHREQLVYQYKSEHFIPGPRIMVELKGSYTNAKSNTPDFKDIAISNEIGYSTMLTANRYYRYLSDKLLDLNAALSFPISDKAGLKRTIKAGGSYQQLNRDFKQYSYGVAFGPASSVIFPYQDVAYFFRPETFSLTTYLGSDNVLYPTIKNYYKRILLPTNHNIGQQSVGALFIMTDYDVNSRLRVAGGVRYEGYDIRTDAYQFDLLGIPEGDPRRNVQGSVFAVQPSKLTNSHYLPSAGIVYKLNNSERRPLSLRLHYGLAVTRPSVRELYDGTMFDYELRSDVFGNADLQETRIENYDLRLESYFENGDNISFSVFYKDFHNHIELFNTSQGYSWQNVPSSSVMGLELEGSKAIVKNLDFRANVSFIASETELVMSTLVLVNGIKVYIPYDTVARPMYGQAPFVVNAMLSYTNDSIGFMASLNFNVQGPRLSIASSMPAVPDVYELPRNLLDLKLSKKLGRHFSMSFLIRDILNSPIKRSYKYPGTWDIDYDTYRWGTSYKLSISYKL